MRMCMYSTYTDIYIYIYIYTHVYQIEPFETAGFMPAIQCWSSISMAVKISEVGRARNKKKPELLTVCFEDAWNMC